MSLTIASIFKQILIICNNANNQRDNSLYLREYNWFWLVYFFEDTLWILLWTNYLICFTIVIFIQLVLVSDFRFD